MASPVRKPQRVKEIVEDSRNWCPEDLLKNLDDEIDRMERGMNHVIFDCECHPVTRHLKPLPVTPTFRMEESRESLEVTVDLPLASKENLQVEIGNDAVEVRADPPDPLSRPYFLRIETRDPLDPEKSTAEFSRGKLRVVAPKLKRARIKVR